MNIFLGRFTLDVEIIGQHINAKKHLEPVVQCIVHPQNEDKTEVFANSVLYNG